MASVMTKQFKTALINILKNMNIPDWINYVTVDKNGDVYGYRLKPTTDNKNNYWEYTASQNTPNFRFLFSIEFDSTDWKKTLINRCEWDETCKVDDFKSTQDSTFTTDLYNSIITNNQSYLSLKLWFPGETTLVGRIIQAINIPHNGKTLQIGCCDEFIIDKGGLKVMNNSNKSSKDMIAMFPSKELRGIYVSLLVDNLKKAFNVNKPRYIKATKDDFNKTVFIESPMKAKGKLVDMTSKGKYVVEVDDKLYIAPKAWKTSMVSGEYILKKTNGDALEIILKM